MRCILLAGLALSLLAGAATTPAAAQRREPAGAQEREGRLMEMFLDHVTAELDLGVDGRQSLRRILRETFERRVRLVEERRQLQRRTREALSDPSTEAATFRRLGEAMIELKRRELGLLDWQRGQLLESLDSRQALRFMLMQERLARRIEAMRRDRARR